MAARDAIVAVGFAVAASQAMSGCVGGFLRRRGTDFNGI